MRGREWRAATAGAAGVALLAVVVGTAAAQGSDTVTEELIRDLNAKLLAVAVPITLVVEGILVYTVWRFSRAEEAMPTRENRTLEITWTVATALVLVYVGIATYGVMADPYVTATPDGVAGSADGTAVAASGAGSVGVAQDRAPVVVEAVGHQWFWEFRYPAANVTRQNRMVVPVNRTLVVRTGSADVIHAFHVPEMGLKADAIPGRTNVIRTVATDTGTFRLYCAEYCGTGHSEMLGNVTVVDGETYEAWLEDPENTSV